MDYDQFRGKEVEAIFIRGDFSPVEYMVHGHLRDIQENVIVFDQCKVWKAEITSSSALRMSQYARATFERKNLVGIFEQVDESSKSFTPIKR